MNRHKWTCKRELKSNLLLEYPKELQLQIAAGIKTFVFVPVLPLGVLQLGSLQELDEDLTMVAQIKDLFCAYQYSLESRSTVDLGMEFQFYMPFSRSLFDNDSDCLTIATELINPINYHLSAMQDSTTLNIDQVMTNELLLGDYDILPELKVQPDELLSQDDGFCQIQFSEEVILDALTSELLSDHSEENLIHNSNMTPVGTIAFDQSFPYFREKEDDSIPFISHCLALEEANISDFSMGDFLQYDCDFFQINGTSTEYGEEFDASMNIMLDNIYLDVSDVSDRQIFIQCNSPVEFHDKEWVASLSDADNFSELLSTFMEEVPQPIGSLVEEPGEFINARMTECSPDASTVEQVGFSDKKDFASSGKCPGSCTPQFKAGDLLPSEIFDLGTYEISNTCPNSNVVMPSPIEDHQDMKCRLLKNCFNTSHGSNRKHKKSDPHKSRPRDRQLIQDRIRELRGLIPNGSKCSIDELLEQAIKHMMFLESVPIHAEKLRQSARAKVSGFPEDGFLIQNIRNNFSYSQNVAEAKRISSTQKYYAGNIHSSILKANLYCQLANNAVF